MNRFKKYRRMKKITLLFIALSGILQVSFAQDYFQLSLQEALDLAMQNRPALLIAQKERTSSSLTTLQSRSGFTPTIGMDADFRYNTILQTSIVPDFTQPNSDARQAVQFGTPLQASAGITLNQSLIDPLKKGSIRANEILEELAVNAVKRTEVELIEAVRSAYYQILLSEAVFDYATSSFLRAEMLWKQLEKRASEKRALPTEVSTAFIAKENAALAKATEEQNILLNKANLLVQIGLPEVDPRNLVLTDDLGTLVSASENPASDDWDPGLRPEYQETLLNQKLAVTNAETEKRSIAPRLNFVGFLGANGFGDNNSSIADIGQSWFGSSYLGLQLSIPFVDFSRSSRIGIQNMAQDKAVLQQRDLDAQINYEVQVASVRLNQAERALTLQKDNIEVASSNLQVITSRFDQGRSLLTDVIDAENLLKQAEQDYLQAVYNLLIARINVEKAKGTLTKDLK
jgi:outer membrane protein TolC